MLRLWALWLRHAFGVWTCRLIGHKLQETDETFAVCARCHRLG